MSFESGVKSYITGVATVRVMFPIDFNDKADISCRQCRFFRRQSQTCGLNGEISYYPERYVGSMCPLELEEVTE